MFKKLLSVMLTIGVIVNVAAMDVSAYQFPNSFWKINEAYLNAVESNDLNKIIEYGQQSINLMLKEPASESGVISVIADRSQNVANSYQKLGMYDKSAEMFEFFLPYAEKMGWEDSIIIANAKIPQFKTSVELYTDNGVSPYYGAKNEPQNGVLFGVIAGSNTRDLIDGESAILLYHELGQNVVFDVERNIQDAAEKGLTVELALNCPYEGSDIANFESKKYDIENISNILKKYESVPVQLRFGAEFNVWGNQADPEQFKEAFRYVSNYFKQNNPNVAMVWSPGAVSKWGEDMNDYYPGDEYVDWVGCSFYQIKYMSGNPNVPEYEAAHFKTGNNADPVLIIHEIIEKYGDRKPIMISESGQGWLVNSSYVSEDTTDWAIQKMKEFYSYLPMVYPQIKFVAYFDHYVNNEINRYDLTGNLRMQSQYIELVNTPRFIKGNNGESSMCYRKLYDNISADSILPVSCYAHVYNETVESVNYYIDGVYNSTSSQMPYTSYIDLSGVSEGIHTIKAVVNTSSGRAIEKEYKINVCSTQGITVMVNGSKVEFDCQPALHSGRTMVPLRAIFEALGAEVEWEQGTQTITAKNGKDTAKFAINSDLLNKNGASVSLDVPAMLVGERTMVPVRAIAESFNCSVSWDSDTKTVIITG